MSRDEDVSKTLGTWLGKAKKIGAAAAVDRSQEARSIDQSQCDLTPATRPAQLNFKIPHSTKKRIKQLAVRDNITLLSHARSHARTVRTRARQAWEMKSHSPQVAVRVQAR